MMKMKMPLRAAPLFLVITAACGSSNSNAPPVLTLQKAPSASGDGQTDTVLATLPNPLRVLASIGTPQAGDTVIWATGGAGASVSPLKSATDANGVATTMWTLGHVAGAQTATASLTGATGSPVTFNATATPGAAATMATPTGDGQAGMIGTILANPLGVMIADAYGNGVSGIMVTWQVTSGSATVSPTNATSNASGVAQTMVTLGNTPGHITITATNAALAGSPKTFAATAQAIPTAASVTVGPNISFKSDRNNTSNPAVDTIAAGGSVTWTWAANSISHSVESIGSPSFASSAIMTTGSYTIMFASAGSYHYDCVVHGSGMTGTIVVR